MVPIAEVFALEAIKWVLKSKFNDREPIPFRVFHRDFEQTFDVKVGVEPLKKEVTGILSNTKRMEELRYTLYQEVQLNYLLNIPIKTMLKNRLNRVGKLVLDNDKHIILFESLDGLFKREGRCPVWTGGEYQRFPPFVNLTTAHGDAPNTTPGNTGREARRQTPRSRQEARREQAQLPVAVNQDDREPSTERRRRHAPRRFWSPVEDVRNERRDSVQDETPNVTPPPQPANGVVRVGHPDHAQFEVNMQDLPAPPPAIVQELKPVVPPAVVRRAVIPDDDIIVIDDEEDPPIPQPVQQLRSWKREIVEDEPRNDAPPAKQVKTEMPEPVQLEQQIKVETGPLSQPVIIQERTIPATVVLRNLLILGKVLKSQSLNELNQRTTKAYADPARQSTNIPFDRFVACVDQSFLMLTDTASEEVDPSVEPMSLEKVLGFIKYFLFTCGISEEDPCVAQMDEEIEKCEAASRVKMIPMENVKHVVNSLFFTATPAIARTA